jgi:hypothetical protein
MALAGLADGLSAAMGDAVGEAEELEEVWDEPPAGSAAVAVQADAKAKASKVVRVKWFKIIPLSGVN